MTIQVDMMFSFSSPTGAFLISMIMMTLFDLLSVLFSSPTGAFLISITYPHVFILNIEFSSPTGAFLISMVELNCFQK